MGFLTVPPLFGIIANHISIALLPTFILLLLIMITMMYEMLLNKTLKGSISKRIVPPSID